MIFGVKYFPWSAHQGNAFAISFRLDDAAAACRGRDDFDAADELRWPRHFATGQPRRVMRHSADDFTRRFMLSECFLLLASQMRDFSFQY